MKIICITGGIGSGKSTVSKIIQTLGYPVYYSDERAKQMYFLPDIKKQIIQLLGKEAYLNDQQINKNYIASKIFSDQLLLKEINRIIHSAVKDDFQKFLNENKEKNIVFKESALIFEAGLQNNCDKIILITAPKNIRVKRVMKRDRLSEEEILQRMDKQWDDDEKIKQSDYVIVNLEEEPLLPKVLETLKKIENDINT
ncbi:MAG: dephospho-CoA kinase [Bacteroidia bacterium]|nr:MAG: dephospho-CoA kinase [Bacteroidia bacterium]